MNHLKIYENITNIPNVLSKILMMRRDLDKLMTDIHSELSSNKNINPDYINQITELQIRIHQLKNDYQNNLPK